MARRKGPHAEVRACAQRYRELTARLAGIGFIWHGSLQKRMLTCGKERCACRTDPKARHGPYAYWTSKEAQKTVSRLLSLDEAELYEEWINNRRELERVVRQMYRLSRRAAKAELKLRAERRRGEVGES